MRLFATTRGESTLVYVKNNATICDISALLFYKNAHHTFMVAAGLVQETLGYGIGHFIIRWHFIIWALYNTVQCGVAI